MIAAAAAVGICLAVFAAPAAAAPGQLFGIAKGNQGLDPADLRKLRATGVHSLRFMLAWSGVQPSPGTTNFGPTDQLLGNLAARGIRAAPFVYGSPPWLTNKPNRPPLGSAARQRAWRQFLTRIVNRYGPGGGYWSGPFQGAHPGAKPKPITSLQIWNEPNLRKFFPQKHGIRKYAQLVKLSDQAIRAANRKVKVVLAGLTGYARPTAWTFLDKFYRVNGIKRHFDAAALHPYAATIGQFKTEVSRVRGVIRKRHDRHTALWLSEVGWGSEKQTRNWPLNKGPQGQRRMLKKSFRFVLKKRRSWHLARLFWFDWRDPPAGTRVGCSFCDSAGLVRHNHKPKPAYRAFRSFAR
jgi:polysaccharide biosynthesis protein PslG